MNPAEPSGGGGVSVVLPHRNHTQFIGQTLARLFAQSEPPAEIVIVDDLSSPEERARLKEILAPHPTARLIALDEWGGVNAAVQRGLAEATREFVFLTAADDLIEPDFFAKSAAALRAYPDAAFAFSEPAEISSDLIERRDFSLYLAPRGGPPRYLSPDEFERLFRRAAFTFSTNTILYRRTALAAVSGFDPALHWHADWAAAHMAALTRGAVFIPEVLALHRVRRDSYARAAMRQWTGHRAIVTAVLQAVQSRAPEAALRLRRAAVLPEYDVRLIPFLLLDPVGRRQARPALFLRIAVRHAWSFLRPFASLGLRRRLRQAANP